MTCVIFTCIDSDGVLLIKIVRPRFRSVAAFLRNVSYEIRGIYLITVAAVGVRLESGRLHISSGRIHLVLGRGFKRSCQLSQHLRVLPDFRNLY